MLRLSLEHLLKRSFRWQFFFAAAAQALSRDQNPTCPSPGMTMLKNLPFKNEPDKFLKLQDRQVHCGLFSEELNPT
jgi:hypothetical protein